MASSVHHGHAQTLQGCPGHITQIKINQNKAEPNKKKFMV